MLRKMLSIGALGLLAIGTAGLTGCAYHEHDYDYDHHGHHDRKLYRYERHYPERHHYKRHHNGGHHYRYRHDHWNDC